MSSHFNLENFLQSVLTFLPIIFFQFIGEIPSPGRREIISFSVIILPDFISLQKCILFRAICIFFISLKEASFTPFPGALSRSSVSYAHFT